MKITEYPSVTDLADNNVLLIDGPSGTKKIAKSDFVYALFDDIPEMHRKIYRGKNLGSSVSSTQSDNIKNGSFHDIWVGDYWEIGDVKYYVADFDLYYDTYLNQSLSHHLVMWPGKHFGAEQFITTTSVSDTNGYGASNIRKSLHGSTGNTEAYTTITSAFSDHLLTYSESLVRGLVPGAYGDLDTTSTVDKYNDCQLELPTIAMLVGGSAVLQSKAYAFPAYGILAEGPLSLFRLNPHRLLCDGDKRAAYWTRDYDWRLPRNYMANFTGDSINGIASNAFSKVRPFFLIA